MEDNTTRITVLVDDKARMGLTKEHEFYAWIKVSGHRILFDTGQGIALMPNAAMLGCGLQLAETLVLSRGHYDHTGAVAQVLKRNPAIKVSCHPDILLSRYSIRDIAMPKDISMNAVNKSAILNLPTEQACWVTHPSRIYSNVGLSGPIPRTHQLEDTGGPFSLDPEGTRPNPVEDNMAMWIQSDRGLVIITGCCHSGLINTMKHGRLISGQEKIQAIIGGFHLLNASRQRLDAIGRALQEWNVDIIIPCHCTGDEAVTCMQKKPGRKVIPGYAGLVWRQ